MLKRRRVTIALGGFVWLASSKLALANNPASRQDAQYQAEPGPGGADCAACQFYLPAPDPASPGHCQLISGPVGPRGYCDFYTQR